MLTNGGNKIKTAEQWEQEMVKRIVQLNDEDRGILKSLHEKTVELSKELSSKHQINVDTGSLLAFLLWRSMNPTTGQIWPR